MNTYRIGTASLELGAGRKTKNDKIDYKAGIVLNKKTGAYIKKNEKICVLYSDSRSGIKTAEQIMIESIKYSRKKPPVPKLIKKIIC
jgi:pyrimidine-nucleoside phosphorylase